ncbi:enterobactin ABC transporter permease [Actinoalloteichus sp. AHMU CJ021]|uniref:Iron complex transport system permease protein n=1 Tax=Actinoalloteichus caeruleus DSM 43889 TaxID=1120930 RepID=A0ABT1JDT0_ACTCY|nr:iron chelate uptake ABC transporter family permease subunit [Actinoalloteichus caeruleus]AUS81114.1 enterobactin ABC transporter permease [Actinoalloteichus sp. AHMU CJ021]MCP2330650.1 iron complex transport system permease protein [Actinoalloteichus caeruleus DSM 43889]
MADTSTSLPTRPAPAPDVDRDRRSAPRLWPRFAVLGLVAVAAVVGVLVWNIPSTPGSRGFWLAVEMRFTTVATILIVACCQAVATVLFHTATNNRILTPSIMGFEAVYVVIQTALVFFFGGAAAAATDGLAKVAIQSLLMVGFATVLYTWLFSGRRGNLHVMLLVGVVLGVGFGSLSSFMQRLLTPSEFDVLSARLFGNLSMSNEAYLPWAALVIAIALGVVWRRRHHLDVIALGRDTATNLGLRYKREVTVLLILTSVLISISTTLVGPMTFFGFIVATLAYQLTGSSQHRHVLPFAFLLSVVTLLGGYFVLRHVFYAAGLLSVIIEFAGGLFFIVHLLRKGAL